MAVEKSEVIRLSTNDLEATIEAFVSEEGYRLDMIKPADDPVDALLSKADSKLYVHERRIPFKSKKGGIHKAAQSVTQTDWHVGRAGMAYRDLIPGRLNGKLIASHIKIADAGEVPDYVHYHKIDFQMIYCWHGRVKVVYEDQGEPFWLHPGDCVLQPPEIRHRVLEAAANTQVIELTSPAVHETWIEHEIQLPTNKINTGRIFGGQRFIHHRATDSNIVYGEFGDFESHHMGIAHASNNAAHVFELRTQNHHSSFESDGKIELNTFYFVLSGRVNLTSERFGELKFTPGDAILIPPRTAYNLSASANSEILCVEI